MLKINLVYANLCVMLKPQDIYTLLGFLNIFDKMSVISKLIFELKPLHPVLHNLQQQDKTYSN